MLWSLLSGTPHRTLITRGTSLTISLISMWLFCALGETTTTMIWMMEMCEPLYLLTLWLCSQVTLTCMLIISSNYLMSFIYEQLTAALWQKVLSRQNWMIAISNLVCSGTSTSTSTTRGRSTIMVLLRSGTRSTSLLCEGTGNGC